MHAPRAHQVSRHIRQHLQLNLTKAKAVCDEYLYVQRAANVVVAAADADEMHLCIILMCVHNTHCKSLGFGYWSVDEWVDERVSTGKKSNFFTLVHNE